MANLKEIRTRISSVTSTKKITSAMKMVSAAKFKKSQDVLFRFRPYNSKINEIVQFITSQDGNLKVDYMQWRKEVKRIGIVLITSNTSMCGAFNMNIIKKAIETHDNFKRSYPSAEITFFCIGRKGVDFLQRRKYGVVELNSLVIDKPNISLTKEVFTLLFDKYRCRQLDRVELVFNRFKNAAVQFHEVKTFLPMSIPKWSQEGKENHDLIIEPNTQHLIEKVLPNYLLTTLHSAVLESCTAEQGARMTAMHQATENATDLLRELILQYNKARQAAITKEILEIVSGANALKG